MACRIPTTSARACAPQMPVARLRSIVPKDRAAQLTPTVRKVAAGAAETTPVVAVTNLVRTLKLLKEAGLWVVGADAEAPRRAHEVDLTGGGAGARRRGDGTTAPHPADLRLDGAAAAAGGRREP